MTTNEQRSGLTNALASGLLLAVVALFVPQAALADGTDWDSYTPTGPTGGDTSWDSYTPSYTDSWDSYTPTRSGSSWDSYTPSYSDSWDSYTPSYYNTYEPTYTPSYTTYSPSYTPSYYSQSYYTQPYYSQSYYTPSYYTPSYNYSYTPPSYNYSSYDYSYDYVYDYEYVYEYDYDYCSNIPGNQSQGYDCYPDRNHSDNDISCELTVDDRTVEEGDEVTLEWDIDGNANYASINHGIGRVDEDGGEEDVEVDEDTTFRLTVRNSHGDEDTCSVTVRVDDENNFSSVSFTGEPTYNPPVVYLSDIPYTGLEDIDPTLLSYWLMLIASAGAGVWFLYRKGMIPHFAFASVDPIDEGHVEEVETGHADVAPEVNAFLSAIENGDTDVAVDHLRDAAANGTGVEEFLAAAESATDDAQLQARVSAALEGAQKTGIRGAKEALA